MSKDKVMIVLTPNDEVITKEFTGFDDVCKEIAGDTGKCAMAEHYMSMHDGMIIPDMISMYGDECGLIEDTACGNKVNALASLVACQMQANNGQEPQVVPFYGNIVLVKDVDGPEGYEAAGFDRTINDEGEQEIDECWMVEDFVLLTKNHNREFLAAMHEEYDDNKPQPEFKVAEWDEIEK